MLIQKKARIILVEKNLISKLVLIGFDNSFGQKMSRSLVANVEEDVLLKSGRVIDCYAR